jgi:hypothetical protein
MITHKPYYKTGTGQVTMDGKVIPQTGELLGYAIFEVEPKNDSQGMLTFFVTRMIEPPMPEDDALSYVASRK